MPFKPLQQPREPRLDEASAQILRNQLTMMNALLQRDNGDILKQMEATANLLTRRS